jgi:hypothetical protein
MKIKPLMGTVVVFMMASCGVKSADLETNQSIIDQPVAVVVPEASPATLDGTMSLGEWDKARVELLSDGSELLLMHDNEYLYLGIRANIPDMIVGNIFIERGDDIAILHSSAALGTATYTKEAERWQRTKGFEWRCRSTGDGPSAQMERQAFLQEENWRANNSRMGTPNELEYQIRISKYPIHLVVTFIPASDIETRLYWPLDLQDDTIVPTPGGMPSSLNLSPDTWAVLEWDK